MPCDPRDPRNADLSRTGVPDQKLIRCDGCLIFTGECVEWSAHIMICPECVECVGLSQSDSVDRSSGGGSLATASAVAEVDEFSDSSATDNSWGEWPGIGN